MLFATLGPTFPVTPGRQIDMMMSRQVAVEPLQIHPERRLAVGTDHALLTTDLFVAARPSRCRWKHDSRARWVVGDLENIPIVDETELAYLRKSMYKA